MASKITSSDLLPNASAALGFVLCFFGVGTFWNPQIFLFDNWGFRGVPSAADRSPEQRQQRRSFLALARIYGSRNFVLGLLTLAIRLSGDRKLMGWSMLLGTLEPLGDGFIQFSLNGAGVMKHWMFVPVSLGVGAGLLGWL
ncbi:hypothetical protein J7T55_002618 [Diaporthe amygdali]|uniref:uncharacterized protein n=1 Tax=Phomopsis amygdali TaxID=1214568 RepID=UPI0022FE57BB|nr:uncharacterized protein J7T55_002618 [Diaporthe amygdali]KAJ0122106.1 hypothetical protein J7T55_002618 [Diaporthe amygdali]